MKHEPQTASELMMENQIAATDECKPSMVLPSDDVRKFLLDAVNQLNFPGQMVEFVVGVKRQIAQASIQGVGGDA